MKIAEIIVALSIALGSVGSFITAIFGLKQGRETKGQLESATEDIATVHKLVNAHADKQDKRIEELHKDLSIERQK